MKLPKLIDLFHRNNSEASLPAVDAVNPIQEASMADTTPMTGPTQAPENPSTGVAAVASDATTKADVPADAIPPAVAAQPAETPATFAELNAEFGDDPAFIVEAQKASMTMPQAYKAYAAKLKAERDCLRKLGEAGKGGEKPIPGGPKNVAMDYETEVARVRAEKNCTLAEAVIEVNRRYPKLREAYVTRVVGAAS
jgi:hypothetical protein